MLHCRSVSPVVLRSNRPRERVCGKLLVLPSLVPLPWVLPASVSDRRRRHRACGRLVHGVKDRSRGRSAQGAGQSAGQVRFRPETVSSLVVSRVACGQSARGERTVRSWGLKLFQRRCLWWGSQDLTADGPPLGRGQSAVESRSLSRGVAVPGRSIM